MRIEIKCAHPSWMVRPMVVYAGGCREYCDLCRSGASDDGPAIAYFDIPDEMAHPKMTISLGRQEGIPSPGQLGSFQDFKPIVP